MLDFLLMLGVKLPVADKIHPQSKKWVWRTRVQAIQAIWVWRTRVQAIKN